MNVLSWVEGRKVQLSCAASLYFLASAITKSPHTGERVSEWVRETERKNTRERETVWERTLERVREREWEREKYFFFIFFFPKCEKFSRQ